MRNNEKGSTLVAAVVIIMVIMVILVAALSMASSYYSASVNDMAQKQVYLSAKSGATLIASYIEEGNASLIPFKVGEEKVIKKIDVEGDNTTKNGRVIKVEENTLKIVVKAEKNDNSYEIQLVMRYEEYKWKVDSYCKVQEGDSLC